MKATRNEVEKRLDIVLDEIAHVREHGATPDALGTLAVSLRVALDVVSDYRGQMIAASMKQGA